MLIVLQYLLGQQLGLSDLAVVDEMYHRSLLHLLENDNADQLMLTFCMDYMVQACVVFRWDCWGMYFLETFN